jgi:uncharacterized membrane protein HdeD (DUF308 family)
VPLVVLAADRASERNWQAKEQRTMVASLASRWWVFLVQGIIMIVLAFLAFNQPATLVKFIGAYAVIDGVLKIIAAFNDQSDDQSRWVPLLIGVLSIVAGLYIWFNPQVAGQILTYVIAAWAIVVGVLLLIWAFRLRQEINDEWLMIIFAVLSIVFGVLAFANVKEGYLTLQWIFAIYMLLGGVLSIILSFRIRSIGQRLGLA